MEISFKKKLFRENILISGARVQVYLKSFFESNFRIVEKISSFANFLLERNREIKTALVSLCLKWDSDIHWEQRLGMETPRSTAFKLLEITIVNFRYNFSIAWKCCRGPLWNIFVTTFRKKSISFITDQISDPNSMIVGSHPNISLIHGPGLLVVW